MANLRLRSFLTIMLSVGGVAGQWDPYFASVSETDKTLRTTMVHLFEWRWVDIAKECEDFLGPMGFGGVQISPPNENVVVSSPPNDVHRPWWERYQPISYKLETRSGSEKEFADMVKRCNKVGVRIYADVVINHMTGALAPGNCSGTAPNNTASHCQARNEDYPNVPFRSRHFNDKKCGTQSGKVENYHNATEVRVCKLEYLNDLDHSQWYVRNKIVEYLNSLLAYGVAGFRIDAAKHMVPSELQLIYEDKGMKRVNIDDSGLSGVTEGMPFIFQEVIDLGYESIKATEYISYGRVTELKYGMALGDVLGKRHNTFHGGPQKLFYLRNFGQDWAFMNGSDAFVFVDNHDNQRGHGSGGEYILTFRNTRRYKEAVAFMLAWPYGVTQVLSSYCWEQNVVNGGDKNSWIGPPNHMDNTLSPHDDKNVIAPELATSENTWSGESCRNKWVAEHRWPETVAMVKFRNVVQSNLSKNGEIEKPDFWWDNSENDKDQIAFGRGNKGFIAINNEEKENGEDLNEFLQTGLEKGIYYDIMSNKNSKDEEKLIYVCEGGGAKIKISHQSEVPIVAFHVDSKISSELSNKILKLCKQEEENFQMKNQIK